MALRRSSKIRKLAILDDYIVYLTEFDFDIKISEDPFMLSQAMSEAKSTFWLDAMRNGLESIYKNQV